MSKPILIIRIPTVKNFEDKQSIINQLLELQKNINDYHILPVMESTSTKAEFEVLNAKDVDLVYLEDLKKTITNIFLNNLEE
jgi:hypothetical protein